MPHADIEFCSCLPSFDYACCHVINFYWLNLLGGEESNLTLSSHLWCIFFVALGFHRLVACTLISLRNTFIYFSRFRTTDFGDLQKTTFQLPSHRLPRAAKYPLWLKNFLIGNSFYFLLRKNWYWANTAVPVIKHSSADTAIIDYTISKF